MFDSARTGCARGAGRRLVALAVGVSAIGLCLGVAGAAAAAPAPPAAGEFVPLNAPGLVDSTTGTGWSGKLAPGATQSVTATGVLGVPATGVLAVMLHVTTADSASSGVNANGNVWAWPAGDTRPHYAIVAKPPAGSSADNTAIVQVGTEGRISFYNGTNGTAVDVSVDVEGYVTSGSTPAAGATFAPLVPARIVDTSNGTGGRSTPLTPSDTWTFHALGVGGIPASGVAAVAINIGARATSTTCWVQVQPAGTSTADGGYPRVDTYANYTAQQLAVVAPDAAGDITFSTNCPSAEVYADVEGYYLAADQGSTGDVYVPARPTRIIDTRRNLGIAGKLTAGRVVSGAGAVSITGVAGVPADADAVALSVGTTNGSTHGYNTIWTDGAAQATSTSTLDVNPNVIESDLIFVGAGPRGKIDVADSSSDRTESNDLYADIEGYFERITPAGSAFSTPQYFPSVRGDTYFNTVGKDGDIVATSNDTTGSDLTCATGSDIAILHGSGTDPAHLGFTTVNCMTSYGPRGQPGSPDGCSWKSGGITRVGATLYLAVARQLRRCSYGLQANGLQPSFNASIVKSVDGGHTWTNPWGTTSTDGAAPPYDGNLKRYRAMFPGQAFSAPFFIQYGPGNTQTVDGADKYLYAVSNDGYAYNGNSLRLARVPLTRIQQAGAWQYYHGAVGGDGRDWTSSATGATSVLQVRRGISQPAIQYLPSLRRYLLVTFTFTHGASDFPQPTETPYTRFRFYTAPKPWGPWTKVLDRPAQRSLWCTASPCELTQQPAATDLTVGTPSDWLGFYDPAIVQKFVFTNPLSEQALFVSGDFKNETIYPGEQLYRLHAMPMDLTAVLRT